MAENKENCTSSSSGGKKATKPAKHFHQNKPQINNKHDVAAIVQEKDTFEDEYLRNYPAKKIIETSFTIEEYETIVNKALAKIAGGQAEMLHAVKALVRLAYCTLMDPTSGSSSSNNNNNKQPEELFFQKHKRFTESWQSVSGRANTKEKPNDQSGADHQVNGDGLPRLKLKVDRDGVPISQRKAAIGVWAMCHMRAMIHSKEWLHRFFAKKDTPSEIIEDIYGFQNPYVFPSFDRDTYELMSMEFSRKRRDPEVLYLLYRGAIILEHIWHRPELRSQKKLLLSIAYGNPNGFREHGLELYTWFRSAARALHIDQKQLSNDLTWALSDGPYNEQSQESVKTVLKLMEFHVKYYSAKEGSATTKEDSPRYFMYARVVDGNFFSHLDADSNEELFSVLVEICRLKGDAYIPDNKVSALWKERAQPLAKKICQRHAKQTNTVVTKSDHAKTGRDSRAPNRAGNEPTQQRANSTHRVMSNHGRPNWAGSTVRPGEHGAPVANGNNQLHKNKNNNNNQYQARPAYRATSQVRNQSGGVSGSPNGNSNNKQPHHQVRAHARAQSPSRSGNSISVAPNAGPAQSQFRAAKIERARVENVSSAPNGNLNHSRYGNNNREWSNHQVTPASYSQNDSNLATKHGNKKKDDACSII